MTQAVLSLVLFSTAPVILQAASEGRDETVRICTVFFLSQQGVRGLVQLPASVVQFDARPTGDQEVAGQAPPGPAPFFRGDWSWIFLYGHFLPSAEKKGGCQFSGEKMYTSSG